MIRISRPPKPPEKQRKRKNTKKAFKYNEDHIVAALWEMQHEKCCYCENIIPKKGHAKAVEHFQPKSVVEELTNEWSNLLLACAQCNGKKSDKFPLKLFKIDDPEAAVIHLKKSSDMKKGSPLLIDPSKEDPEKHLDFICDIYDPLCGLIKSKNNSDKGDFSIKTLGLSDIYYTKIHHDFLRNLVFNLLALTRARDNKDDMSVQLCKSFFMQYTTANYKLAGLARSYIYNNNIDSTYGIVVGK